MTNDKPILRVGLIGTGFMGKTHAFGFASAPQVFDLPYEIVLHVIADRSDELASKAAQALGFAHATGDWRTLIQDPEIDLVDITAPNAFHKEMALAAIAFTICGFDVRCCESTAMGRASGWHVCGSSWHR